MSVTAVALVNSLNHHMLVKQFVSRQLDVMSVRSVVLANSLNHQLLVNLSFPIMSVTSTVLANLSNHLMLLKLSFPVTQIIVICNSTCKPVSNFVSDCQSVKPAHKLTDVYRNCPHVQLVNSKNSRQHDFTKPFIAVNILIMSIYFYELVLLFFIFHHNFWNNNVHNFFKRYVRCNNFSTNKFLMSNSVTIFNIPHKNVLSSSVHFC